MNRPLVSVVMPVYNAGKYLKEAIQSILNQSYTNLEFIIVNDGSTDDSREIIRNMRDSRIRFFENPENWGIVKTRNLCLTEAQGKYIAVIDSDDIARPERIRQQVEFLEGNPDFGMCGSYFQTIDGTGVLLKTVDFPSNDRDARSMLMVHNCFCHSTIMMRAAIAKQLMYKTGFDVAEDYELWYRISRLSKILNLPQYTTFYRVHGNNISISKNVQMFRIMDKINRCILSDLGISFSEDELSVHSNSLHYNSTFFKAEGKMEALENWICKFLDYIDRDPQYNEKLIYRVFAEKWIVLCFKTRQYKKLAINRVAGRNPGIYRKIVLKKLLKNLNR